jgi:hypothetical protein
MSELRGFDRIALLLAFIAIFPGFYVGYSFHQSEFAKFVESKGPFNVGDILPHEDGSAPGKKYVRPPIPISIVVGLLSALASLLLVLYGIRYGMRGGVQLYKWIAEGFKDDSSKDG